MNRFRTCNIIFLPPGGCCEFSALCDKHDDCVIGSFDYDCHADGGFGRSTSGSMTISYAREPVGQPPVMPSPTEAWPLRTNILGVGVAVLPIIGGLLVVTVLSDVLQIFWKRVFGRKLLRIAPLHHHFEAIGWPSYKVVMRYWVLSIIFAFAGVILALSVL